MKATHRILHAVVFAALYALGMHLLPADTIHLGGTVVVLIGAKMHYPKMGFAIIYAVVFGFAIGSFAAQTEDKQPIIAQDKYGLVLFLISVVAKIVMDVFSMVCGWKVS